jgi:hypothetical protein
MARAWAKLHCGALSSSSGLFGSLGDSEITADLCTNEAYLQPGNSYDCQICFKTIGELYSPSSEECVSAGSVTVPELCNCSTVNKTTESGNSCGGWSEYFDMSQGTVQLIGDDENGYTATGTGVDESLYCNSCPIEGTRFDLCGCGNGPENKTFYGSGGEPQYSDWEPDPSTICEGETFYQTKMLLDSSCRCCSDGCDEITANEPSVGTRPPEYSEWNPPVESRCDGVEFEQTAWEVNGCGPDAHQMAVGTGPCDCDCVSWGMAEPGESCGDGRRNGGSVTISGILNGVECPPVDCEECIDCIYPDESTEANWSPSRADFYDCEDVEQSLAGDHPDCPPKTRTINGLKNPYLDDNLSWSPPADTECPGVTVEQTAEHPVCGTLTQYTQGAAVAAWSEWSPGPEDICAGQVFTQSRHDLNGCVFPDESQQSTGTSTDEDCSCNCEALGDVEPGGQCPPGHRAGANIIYTAANLPNCGQDIECMECIECTYSGPWEPAPSTECEGVEFEQTRAGNHPDCPPQIQMAFGTKSVNWGPWTGDSPDDICVGSQGSRSRSDQNGCSPDETETVDGSKDCSSPAEAPIGEV